MPQADTATPVWPWPNTDPVAWMRTWSSAFGAAPQSLQQPILPGWSFGPVLNITSNNSASPQTEVEVVQRFSYGRQLGRMADALEALIAERGPKAKADERFDVFSKMNAEIDAMKLDAAADRVARLQADLATLKASRPDEYARLKGALRAALDA